MSYHFWRALLWLESRYHRIRFGEITEEIRGYAGDHSASEVEYRGRSGKIIGYWSYGYFDPHLPYRGSRVLRWRYPERIYD